MKPIPIHEAKARLSQLIQRACAGEEVIIARGKQPLVRLVPLDFEAPKRRFGAYADRVQVADSFFEPLPEEELQSWEG